ncbi:hypothetical protein [Mucilaginibacter sp.]
MKFKKGQQVILLAIDGKPAAGKAVVDYVDEVGKCYTVSHSLNDSATAVAIDNVPEGRIVTLSEIAQAAPNNHQVD